MPLLNAAVLPGAVGLHGGLGLTLGYRELLWKLKTKAGSQRHQLQAALEHRAQTDAPRTTPRLASLIAVPVRVFKQNVVLAKLHRRWLACKGELRGAASEVRVCVLCAPTPGRVCGRRALAPRPPRAVHEHVAHAIRSNGLTVAPHYSARRLVREEGGGVFGAAHSSHSLHGADALSPAVCLYVRVCGMLLWPRSRCSIWRLRAPPPQPGVCDLVTAAVRRGRRARRVW